MTITETSTTALLRYLQAGGRPEVVPGFGLLRDTILIVAAHGEAVHSVEHLRVKATEPAPHPNWASDHHWQIYNTYEADLLEDGQTREAFWDALAPSTRKKLEDDIRNARQPIVLTVCPGDAGRCDVCGDEIASGSERIQLAERSAGYAGLEEPLSLCMGCVSQAALGVREGEPAAA